MLAPAATYTAAVRVTHASCAAGATGTDVPLPVALNYDAPSDSLTVTVSYPPDPCVPATLATVALTAELAPSAYAPQTQLPAAIADPALQ